MPLTDIAIKKALPREKPYKLSDGEGMYLLVNSTGKYWRLDYRYLGKRKTLALGTYPTVSLADARDRKSLASNGVPVRLRPRHHLNNLDSTIREELSKKGLRLNRYLACFNTLSVISTLGPI